MACRSSTSTSCRPTAVRCESTAGTSAREMSAERVDAMIASRAGSRSRRRHDIRLVRRSRGRASKRSILEFLIGVQRDGKTIAGYGAPGKANTLLNYCGIGPDLLPYTVDRNPYKQGRFTPGMRIPIDHPDRLERDRPDIVWILPWNLRSEIAAQLSYVRTGAAGCSWRSRRPRSWNPATPVAGATPRSRPTDEGRAVLRRPGASPARLRGDPPQADGADRPAPGPVACHALLRPLRVQGLPALSRLQGRSHQGLLPATTTRRCPTISSCPTAVARWS